MKMTKRKLINKFKNKITFIGEYLLSFPGGAEKSIFNILKELSKNHEINTITFDNKYKNGVFNVDGIKIINKGLNKNFNISRIINLYSLNEAWILNELEKNKIKLKESKYIIIQGIFAPLVAQFCIKNKIPYHYYLRDELQLNIFINYETGFKRILKIGKSLLEFRTVKKYKKLNVLALKNASKIIANSKYMKNELKKRFSLKSELKYPFIGFSKFVKSQYTFKSKDSKYITFIGGKNAMKGYDIILKIAKLLPKEEFLIIGPYRNKYIRKNITFMPWQKDVNSVYNKTKLLLVPSRWNEAFGRVVVEANHFRIPTITSNKGGLPEANKNKKDIICDINNIDLWIDKINHNL